jgi:hypothetical protein
LIGGRLAGDSGSSERFQELLKITYLRIGTKMNNILQGEKWVHFLHNRIVKTFAKSQNQNSDIKNAPQDT